MKDKKNTEIRGLLGLYPVSLTIKRSILRWFGHNKGKDDADWLKQCMKIECEGIQQSGHPKKTWWDFVKEDMESFGLSCKDALNKDHCRLKKGVIG